MNEEITLYMTFKTENGKNCTISLDEPREDIQEQEIIDFMNLVLAKNLFMVSGYDLVTAVSAKIVNKDTIEFDLEV